MSEQPPALQLLDDRGELAAADDAERSLEHFIAHKSGLAADAANFAVVSIMGPQSSGKSTLMNQLFGTPFAVMDSAQGRSQTTKGAWLSTSANNTLVLDLQGTDSIESGDGGKTFERQSSLLALALCDVVIVNVWSNDLGRADASNMSLLRTVFEVHLQLFGGAAAKRGAPPKTTLLFLIRDHIAEQTPLEKLEEMVHRDVASVWAAADKPEGFDGGVESVFAIQIAGLPHFVFQRAAFDDAAAALRRRFERGAPETLLPPPAADAVPLDGLGAYVHQLWSAIRAEEDLDLPTHKQALATHRCAQIADGLLRDARAALEPHRKAVEKTTIPLPSLLWCHAIAEECIRGYAAATKRYDKGRAAARRAELRAQLRAEAAPLVRANNALHVDAKTAEFEAALKAAVPADRVMPRFRLAVAAMAAEAESSLTSEVRESIGELPKLLDDDETSGRHSPAADDGDGDGGGGELRALCDGAGAELRARVAAARDGALASQRALLLDAAKGAARDALTKALDTTLTKLPPTTWADVARARDAEGEEATVRARFAEEIDGLAAEGSEAARAALAASLVPPLRRHAVEVVREGVGREVHSLRHRLGRTFDRAFRYDEGGLPRAWAPDDDVKGAWAKAKKAALTQLHLFGEAAAAEACGGDAPLAAALAAELKEAVDDEAAAAFESAKAAQAATAAAARLPTWVYVVLPILGANEAIAILSSSFARSLLVLAAIVVAAAELNAPGTPMRYARQAWEQINAAAAAR